MNIPRPTPFETADVPDLVLLHATLVHDCAVPNGYLGPFLSLESQLHAAAGRVDRRNAATTNVFSAAQRLHSQKLCSRVRLRGKTQRPRERNKWLDVFADLLLASSTPTSALLRDDRASRKLLGAGRRAGTMRARERSIQKFSRWLAKSHTGRRTCTWRSSCKYDTPSRVREARSDLRMPLSYSWKNWPGVPKISARNHCMFQPRRSSCRRHWDHRESKQAPRFPVVILAALEELLTDLAQERTSRQVSDW